MRLYQVEICKSRSAPTRGPGRFDMVLAEDYERARRKARFELCGRGEQIGWICEVPAEDAEAVLA